MNDRIGARVALAAAGLALLIATAVTAGADEAAEAQIFGAAAHKAIVEEIAESMMATYVFPEVAEKMAAMIRSNLANGVYDSLSEPYDLCDRLTADLRSVSNDKHISVRYSPPAPGEAEELTEEERMERFYARSRETNFEFKRLEILEGNVGYLRLDGFIPAEMGGATAVAAMNFLANARALIFDLRGNGGGSPSMIQLITSYFYDEPTHLNSFYIRASDETKQFWTQSHVDGPRFAADLPVFVLTSNYTFSGAEEFSYNLKNLERATIVGETTGGGAHPVKFHRIEDYDVSVSVPYGRAVNPITDSNWEGSGVEPHIQVPADQALDVAHLEALKVLEERETDGPRQAGLAWARESIRARLEPVSLSEEELVAYVGSYGPRTISLEQGSLHYQREGRPSFELQPMGEDRFMVKDLDFFRLRFERDDGGAVIRIVGLYADGRRDANDRDDP